MAQNFQLDFVGKWSSRTFCAGAYVMDRCANFTPQDACNGDDPSETGNVDKTGCPAVVPSTLPVAPGKATVFPGQQPQSLPQGPSGAPAPSAQPGVIGPGGAPAMPPGSVPPGSVPPGAAPPGTAPPSTAPPGG